MPLICCFYPVLSSRKEISGNIIVQHLGSKMLISSNRASKHVGFSVIQRELCQWMEAVPPIPCHQPAFCLMLLWVFFRKLKEAISGYSWRLCPPRKVGIELGTWHSKPQQAMPSTCWMIWTPTQARWHKTPIQGDHFADFLRSLAVI